MFPLYYFDWGQHISKISSKATKTMSFLRRNLALSPRHTIEVAYKKWVALSSSMQYLFGIPITKTPIQQVDSCQVDMWAMEKHK